MKRDPWYTAGLATVLLLWTVGALVRGLWLDEFHSLYHDRAPDLASLLASVRTDNHAPLSFLFQRASIRLFGESALALRVPSLLTGAAFLLLIGHVARRLPHRSGRIHAVWIAGLSSFSFDVFTEARMYGLLALTSLGLLESVLAAFEGKRSRWWVTLWIAVGLHTHYYFLHGAFVLACVVGGAACARPDLRRSAGRLFLPACVGVLLFVPWALYGLRHQLAHGLPSGGQYHGFVALVQSFGHLLYINASLGGPLVTYGVALPGTLAAAILAFLGLRRLGFPRKESESRLFLELLVGLAFLVPVWMHLVTAFFERASFGWRYIAGSLGPVVLIVACGMSGTERWRAALRGIVFLTLPIVTLVTIVTGGREDFRAVVAHVLANARPGDVVVPKPLWFKDPEHSPTAWDYYAPRLAHRFDEPPPEVIPFDEFERALRHPRVWIFLRDDFYAWHVMEAFREHYPREDVWQVRPILRVHLFSRDENTAQR